MFDISFTELLVIGVIALIVLGPERLPKVARTVGHLLGRAQRYVSEVKTDIEREINLEEVNSIKNQVKEAAESVKASVTATTKQISDPLEEARRAVNSFANETEKSVESAIQEHTTAISGATPALEDNQQPGQAELPLSATDSTSTEATSEPTTKIASSDASITTSKGTP